MGAELERRERITPNKIGQFFLETCPFYMSIGMSYKEFWEGDICLPKIYMQSFKLKKEREAQRDNYNAWLNGIYTTKAFEVVMCNAFAKKGTPAARYYDKPISMDEQETEEEREKKVENERLIALVALNNFVNYYKKENKHNGKQRND